MAKSDKRYVIIKENTNRIIAENLKKLLEARHMSVHQFVNVMDEECGFCSPQYFGNLLNHPEKTNFTAAMALLCCDFFGVSLENLASSDFDPNERRECDTEIHRKYLDIERMLVKETQESAERTRKAENAEYNRENADRNGGEENPGARAMPHMSLGLEETTLIMDPKHKLFRGYLLDYYCYYYPTSSKENRESSDMVRGILSLKDNGESCEAVLRIDTSGGKSRPEDYSKIYAGFAVISTTVNSIFCIMFGKETEEFCVLSFRHFAIFEGHQFCRIAVALSSSSGSEKRRPTVLRMFLSSEEIQDKDLNFVGAAVRLNYSMILVSRERLSALCEDNPKYRPLLKDLAQEEKMEQMLMLHEQEDVYQTARRKLGSKEEALEFIMRLREVSYSYKYNKISEKADKNITELLAHKGYYKGTE